MIILLTAITVSGSLVVWARCRPGLPLEISLPQDSEVDGDILIGGAVTSPGYYPFTDSAVISVGADNTFGHPSDEVLARLEGEIGEEHVYRTDEHGTIEFITDGERLWVKVER